MIFFMMDFILIQPILRVVKLDYVTVLIVLMLCFLVILLRHIVVLRFRNQQLRFEIERKKAFFELSHDRPSCKKTRQAFYQDLED